MNVRKNSNKHMTGTRLVFSIYKELEEAYKVRKISRIGKEHNKGKSSSEKQLPVIFCSSPSSPSFKSYSSSS